MRSSSQKPGSEAELIDLFKNLFEPAIPPSDLLIGIGDDAAAFEPGVDPETKFVITTDMLVEDVHFRRKFHTMYDIGWRTAAANISDIAAMGAYPRWAVVTLASSPDMSTDDIMDFARGINDVFSHQSTYVIGGDLTHSTGKISTSMTVIGETTGRILTRSGAQLGDFIAVTGTLGSSGAGLALLENDAPELPSETKKQIIDIHLRPQPRTSIGQALANIDGIHAMMDISDGLGIDLGRLCRASRVGARIFEEKFPISDNVMKAALALDCDHLEFVSAGEDFELLVTGDEIAINQAAEYLASINETGLTVIGEIIDQPFGIHLARVNGVVIDPTRLGWDHYRNQTNE